MKTFLMNVGSAAATPEGSDLRSVLQRVYSAVVSGDFDTFADALTDDVALNISGFGPMDGVWRGRTDVVAATRKNFSMVEGLRGP